MQTFAIGLGRGWAVRLLGRNPLVRSSDRIEVMVLGLAVLVDRRGGADSGGDWHLRRTTHARGFTPRRRRPDIR